MPWRRVSFMVTLALTIFVLVIFAASFGLKRDARVLPFGVSVPLLFLLLLIAVGEFYPKLEQFFEIRWTNEASVEDTESEAGALEEEGVSARKVELGELPWGLVGLVFGSLLAFGVGVLLIGFVVTGPAFVLLFARLYGGASWRGSAALAIGTWAGMVGLERFLRVDLYRGLLMGATLPPF